jgi:two-component system LytT family sensor kinase
MTAAILERYATAAAAGFLATLLLRFLYKTLNIRDRSILSLSLTAVAFSFLGANIVIWVADLLKLPFSGSKALAANLNLMSYVGRIIWWMTPLIGWSALYFGINFWHQWAVQKERTEKAKALVQTAQLQMLRYRLNPHFLFNTLNSIRALIPDDKTSAKSMITELSEFLRYSLVSKNYENVPFKDEIESVRHYFNIQKMRYENKLDVSFEVDPAAEEYPVASFLLYPLAENAVKHGLRTSPLPLQIRIWAGVRQGCLEVEIVNSGSWVKDPGPDSNHVIGQGLDNVRRRLAESYPEKHHLDILEKDGSVHIKLSIQNDMRR